jgi:hypothetical protein
VPGLEHFMEQYVTDFFTSDLLTQKTKKCLQNIKQVAAVYHGLRAAVNIVYTGTRCVQRLKDFRDRRNHSRSERQDHQYHCLNEHLPL